MASPVKDAKAKAQTIWPGATVDSRGKGWIKHAHPTEGGRFMLSTQVGGRGWHFGDGEFTEANEVDTAWVDADPVLDAPWEYKMVLADYNAYFAPGSQLFNAGEIIKYDHVGSGESVTFQAQSLNWVNDLDQISQISIAQPITPTSIDDDTIRWNGAYGSGLDFEWQTQTVRLSKKLHIDSGSSLGTPPQFIIDGGGAALGLKFIFSHSDDIDIYIDDVLWDKKSNNPQTTSSNVEFRLNGETLWYFVHPWANDNSSNKPQLQTRFTASAQNLFVEVQVLWAWLETAVYPVVIDPTVNEVVGVTADDGFEYPEDTWTGNTCWFGYCGSDQWSCTRFQTVDVPNSASITVATYTLTEMDDEGGDYDVYTKVRGEQTGDADAPSGTNYPSDMTLTDAGIDLDINSLDWTNNEETEVTVTSVIQEIVNLGGWVADNDLNIVIENDGTTGCGDLRFYDYSDDSGKAATLDIEYSGDLSASETDDITIGESIDADLTIGIEIEHDDPAYQDAGLKVWP